MTDAKELAAKLRREAECDAHNAARDSTAGRHIWANECAASAAIKREAADALEAQAEELAAERARCAKIAEEYGGDKNAGERVARRVGLAIAAAIRVGEKA